VKEPLTSAHHCLPLTLGRETAPENSLRIPFACLHMLQFLKTSNFFASCFLTPGRLQQLHSCLVRSALECPNILCHVEIGSVLATSTRLQLDGS